MAETFFLAAGGTGGHLFPAFALAEELGRRGHTVDLVTDARGDRYGSDFPARTTHRIPAATFRGVSLTSLRAVIRLSRGVVASRTLIRKHRPAAVIGFGGYPTFPPLVAAGLTGTPSAIHEANAVMGRANRALASRVTMIATSFADTAAIDPKLAPRIRHTGNPVRDTVRAHAGRPYAPATPEGPFNLLVFGGSQGARYFSDTVPDAVRLLPAPTRARLRVTQQCRDEDIARVRATYADAGVDADLATFFTDLPERMATAHLVVARAGASSVSELEVLGRPSFLVPLPHAIDNDQLRNARALAAAGGAWCLEQATLDAQTFAAELSGVMDAPYRLGAAAIAAAGQARPDAVDRLADLAEELASQRPAKAGR
ncbi:MAG: UDP-N-acetylglucosamine--N-acetylmuramyl-(pentapeptide) pyrophosphoryl-undecaprenol N-acetylglucosamine transferase [Pseudomonadota bacterium]